ncbi:MAG: CRISPR-associated helicase Cas3' [Methanoregulaceae archaeon]|nr:CRISPR-associated helicase Cas3' [Methanoregulaceae archaeon]
MDDLIFQYWGKSSKEAGHHHHLLVYHSLDVAAVANTIISESPLIQNKISDLTGWSKDESIKFVTFWLAIHDLGKFSESFQGLQPELYYTLNGKNPRLSYPLHHGPLGYRIFDDLIIKKLLDGTLIPIPDGMKKRDLEDIITYCSSSSFGHHGTPPDNSRIGNYNKSQLYSSQDAKAAELFINACLKLFIEDGALIPCAVGKDKKKNFAKLSWIITGLAVLSDWIASNNSFFSYHQEKIPLEVYWEKYALPNAKAALEKSGASSIAVSKQTGVEAIFPFFKDKEIIPSPLQEYASNAPICNSPHLYIVEESTGGGKTEAAVTLGHRLMAMGLAEGLYIGLPTMATANAMYERMAESYRNLYDPAEEPSLILAHGARQHSSLFLSSIGNSVKQNNSSRNDEPNSEIVCSRWLADNRKKALLAPVGVGTIDQALVSILPARHQSLRLFGLCRNVLIVDEVHAYDSYMSRLLQTLLAFLAALGASAILLSATLPISLKKKLINAYAEGAGWDLYTLSSIDYPLITHLSNEGLEEVHVPARKGTDRSVDVELIDNENEVVERLLSVIKEGKCACWIRNTVYDALHGYHKFESMIPAENLMLFHSRYMMGDRLNIENEVLRRFGKVSSEEDRKGRLVISTQVIEQSLDIDFDYMVSDLAPVDLIIQRAGRLQRHNRKEKRNKPTLWIFSPEPVPEPMKKWYETLFPRASFVYPKHGDLYLTAKLLKERRRISTPDDARLLIEGVYGSDAQETIPSSLKDRDRIAEYERTHAEGEAVNKGLDINNGYRYGQKWQDDEDAPTRLADPSVTLRLGLYDRVKDLVIPLENSGKERWDLCDVTVRKQNFPIIPKYGSLESIVEKAKETMPDHGDWSILLPLESMNDNRWGGIFSDNEGRAFEVIYSREEGLMLSKQ